MESNKERMKEDGRKKERRNKRENKNKCGAKEVVHVAKKISTAEAAAIIGASPQFVRMAMQQGVLNIGSCLKMSSKWTYNISPKLLADYTGKDIEKEIEMLRNEKKEIV